jgi:DNA-binding CsgD family transcriptional regulator
MMSKRQTKRSASAARVNPDSQIMVRLVLVLVVGLAATSFALGVPGLMTVGRWAQLPSPLLWGVPAMIDGGIMVSSLAATVARQRRESAAFAWTMVGILTLASMAAQAAHVIVTSGDEWQTIPVIAGASLAAAFPASVWAATHLALQTAVTPPPEGEDAPRPAPRAAKSTSAPATPVVRPEVEPQSAPHLAAVAEAPADRSERDARIVELDAEGRSSREIAEVVGVNRSTVSRVLQRAKAADPAA